MNGSLRAKGLRYVVPAILITVALGQQSLVHGPALSPWKGAGFGMFSTIDEPGTRIVTAFLVQDTLTTRMDLAPLLREESPARRALLRVRAIPSASARSRAREQLALVRWTLRKDPTDTWLVPAREGDPAFRLPAASRIHLEVWSRSFEVGSLEVRLVPVASDQNRP